MTPHDMMSLLNGRGKMNVILAYRDLRQLVVLLVVGVGVVVVVGVGGGTSSR